MASVTASEIVTKLKIDDSTFVDALKTVNDSLNSLLEGVRNMTVALNAARSAINSSEKAMESVSASATKVAEGFGSVEKAAEKAAEAVKDSAVAMDDAKPEAPKPQSVMGGLSDIAGMVAVGATLKESIQLAGDFADSLANIQSIADGMDMERVKSGLSGLDSALGAPAKLADAMYYAVSSGVRGSEDQLVKFTQRVSELGVATNTDLTPAMDALTTVMNAYGYGVEDSGKLCDWFFQIVKSGKAEGPALATSLGQVISTAAMTKIPIEELGAAIATLSLTMPTEQAIVALNMGIQGMIDPSNEAAKVLKELGVEISAKDLAENGLVASLAKVQAACNGNIDVLSQLFGSVRAVKSMAALTGTQFEQFGGILDEFYSNAGVSTEAFRVKTESMGAKMRKIWTNLQKIMISLGETFEPVISFFANMDATAYTFIGTTAAVALGIAAVTKAVMMLRTAFIALSAANPFVLIAGGIALIVSEIVGMFAGLEQGREEYKKLLDERADKSKSKLDKQIAENDSDQKKLDTLKVLSGKGQLSDADFKTAMRLKNELNERYPALGIYANSAKNMISVDDGAQRTLDNTQANKTLSNITALIRDKEMSLNAKVESEAERYNYDPLYTEKMDSIDSEGRRLAAEYAGTHKEKGSQVYRDYVQAQLVSQKYPEEMAEIQRLRDRASYIMGGDKSAMSGKYETPAQRTAREMKEIMERDEADRRESLKRQKAAQEAATKINEAALSETERKIKKEHELYTKNKQVLEARRADLMTGELDSKGTLELQDITEAIAKNESNYRTNVDEINTKANEEARKAAEAFAKTSAGFDDRLKSLNAKRVEAGEMKSINKEVDKLEKDGKKQEIVEYLKGIITATQAQVAGRLNAYENTRENAAKDGKYTDSETADINRAFADYQASLTKLDALQSKLDAAETRVQKTAPEKTEKEFTNSLLRIGGAGIGGANNYDKSNNDYLKRIAEAVRMEKWRLA